MNVSKKQMVTELLKSIETGDTAPIAFINPDKYIQHNLSAADGLAGFGELLKQLPPHSAKVKTVRIFQDGDLVFCSHRIRFLRPENRFRHLPLRERSDCRTLG